jgi:hypothetical protein
MLGWSRKAVEILQNLRLQEIASARSFRLMLLGVVTVCEYTFGESSQYLEISLII